MHFVNLLIYSVRQYGYGGNFPKGTDFDTVTAAEVKEVEDWINNYPREILGFKSASFVFSAAFTETA